MKKNNPKAPRRRDKKYIPKKGTNPEEFSKRICMLNEKIDKNNKLAEMKEHALYEYIALMTNFASHDLKNAVHNLDGFVNTLDISNVKPEDIDTINECIENIRKTISDFKTLSPDESKNEFSLSELGKAVELLNRGALNTNNIAVAYEYDKSNKACIKQSLHNVIQMINNLILNSTKALAEIKDKRLYISIKIQDEEVIIKVCDNGIGIKDNVKDKIFNLHFSTTGGSGIGLYHTKYIVESMNGSISYSRNSNNYNTIFTLKFPIYEQSVNTNN
jgi:signal transduction histidine kinase|nr:MAG TPA: Signal transduction histidine kinase [Caudoviricetes sp.]